MAYPISTGRVAKVLGVSEPQLNDLIRRGRVEPLPPVVAGRRLWSEEHVAAAGRALAERRTGAKNTEAAE